MARKVRVVSRINDPAVDAQMQEIIRVVNETNHETDIHVEQENPHNTRPEDVFRELPDIPKFDTCEFIWNVTLRWHKARGANSYEVRTNLNWGNPEGLIYLGNTTTHIFQPGMRSYTFYLRSINAADKYSEGYSEIELSKPTPSTPPQPEIKTYFNALLVKINRVSDEGISGYYCYFTKDGVTEKRPVYGDSTEYAVETGEVVTIEVSAFDVLGEGSKSEPINATPTALQDRDIPDDIITESKLQGSIKEKIDLGVTQSSTALSQISDLDGVVDGALTEIDSAKVRITDAETDLLDAKDRISDAEINIADAKNRLSGVEGEVDNAKDRLDSAESELENIDGIVTTHDQQITNLEGELSSKVSQSEFNSLEGTVTSQGTQITQNATAITQKADKSTVNTLTGRVSAAEATLSTHAEEIEARATKEEVDTIEGRVTEAEGQLTIQAGKIEAKAEKSEVQALEDDLSSVSTQVGTLTTSYNSISARVEAVEGVTDDLTGEVSGVKSRTGSLEVRAGNIEASVSSLEEDIDEHGTRLSTAEASITANTNQISLKANAADVYTKSEVNTELGKKVNTTTYNQKIGELDVSIDGISGRVSNTETQITDLEGEVIAEVERLDGKIDILPGLIELKADSTIVDEQGTRITTAEQNISALDGAITQTVARVDQSAILKPQGGKLWHFDTSLESTDGIKPLEGAVATLRPNEGRFGGAVAVDVDGILAYPISLADDHTIACYRKSHTDEDYRHVVKRSDGTVFVDGVEDSEYDVGWIAGRNLLLNSDFLDGHDGWVRQRTPYTITDGILAMYTGSSIYQRNAMGSDDYVVSCLVRGIGELNVHQGGVTGLTRYIDSETTFIWVYFYLTGGGNGNLVIDCLDGIIEIDKIKLEKGSTATHWTPAPEDLGYDGDTLMLSNQTGLIDELLVLDYEATEEEIQSWYESKKPFIDQDEINYHGSQIKQTADNIRHEILNLSDDLTGQISAVDQKADNINLALQGFENDVLNQFASIDLSLGAITATVGNVEQDLYTEIQQTESRISTLITDLDDDLTGQITGIDQTIGNINLHLADVENGMIGKFAEIDQSLDAITQTVGDNESGLVGQMALLADQWTVKLNADGNVAGVGLAFDDDNISEFAIIADKFSVATPYGGVTRTKTILEDTYLYINDSTPYGHWDLLTLGGDRTHILLKTPEIPENATSLKLHLYGDLYDSNDDFILHFQCIAQDWDEDTANYNSFHNQYVGVKLDFPMAGDLEEGWRWYEFDVTPLLEVIKNNETYGIALTATGLYEGTFYSKESTNKDFHPYVEYIQPNVNVFTVTDGKVYLIGDMIAEGSILAEQLEADIMKTLLLQAKLAIIDDADILKLDAERLYVGDSIKIHDGRIAIEGYKGATQKVNITGDTFINSLVSNDNHSTNTGLNLGLYYSEPWIRNIPIPSWIESIYTVKLRLYVSYADIKYDRPLTISAIGSDWNYQTLTYNNRPTAVTHTITASQDEIETIQEGQWAEFDITDIYKKWWTGEIPNYGLKISHTTHPEYVNFRSSRVADLEPHILLDCQVSEEETKAALGDLSGLPWLGGQIPQGTNGAMLKDAYLSGRFSVAQNDKLLADLYKDSLGGRLAIHDNDGKPLIAIGASDWEHYASGTIKIYNPLVENPTASDFIFNVGAREEKTILSVASHNSSQGVAFNIDSDDAALAMGVFNGPNKAFSKGLSLRSDGITVRQQLVNNHGTYSGGSWSGSYIGDGFADRYIMMPVVARLVIVYTQQFEEAYLAGMDDYGLNLLTGNRINRVFLSGRHLVVSLSNGNSSGRRYNFVAFG